MAIHRQSVRCCEGCYVRGVCAACAVCARRARCVRGLRGVWRRARCVRGLRGVCAACAVCARRARCVAACAVCGGVSGVCPRAAAPRRVHSRPRKPSA
eukprot:2394161-Prymnesium_polylepis.1